MAAAPATQMMPDPHDAAWEKMTGSLDALSARYPGRVSIYLKDLRSGRVWMHNPDDLFPAASLIKVPILIATFYRLKEGGLYLDERLKITRLNRRGGSGSLKWRPDGTKLTLRRAHAHDQRVGQHRHPDGARALGIGYVQQQFPRMGLLYTGIYEEGMSIKGGRVAHENYTTAREMEMLLEKIYRGEAVDKPSSNIMMEILRSPRPWRRAYKRACRPVGRSRTRPASCARPATTPPSSSRPAATTRSRC